MKLEFNQEEPSGSYVARRCRFHSAVLARPPHNYCYTVLCYKVTDPFDRDLTDCEPRIEARYYAVKATGQSQCVRAGTLMNE